MHKSSSTVIELLTCYNLTEQYQDEEDPRNVQVPENEGKHATEGLEPESNVYVKTLRVCKLNIGMIENPKFMNIGHY
jgi:hypothetical protein